MGATDTAKASFGTKLYSKLALKKGNLFLSPYSILTALGMAAAGAKGETRKVLCSLLGCPNENAQHDAYFKKLIDGVNGPGGQRPYDLVSANALWGHVDYDFNEDFRTNVKANYGGSFNEVDYVAKPQAAVDTINALVGEKTKGRIPKLIELADVNKDTRLILTNAIYFKGKWTMPFDKAMTKNGSFYGQERTTEVPLMQSRNDQHYYETEGFQAVDLPYSGDDLSMLIVLPEKGKDLSVLEQRWDDSTYQQTVQGLWEEEGVNLYMPRFKLEASLKLKPVLTDLGAELAFSNEADFTGIGPEKLKIAEVIHKALVECDEEGTEAAAATAVTMMKCAAAMNPKTPKIFRADRPFMFFIRNKNTGEILFQGRATDL